MKKAWCLLSVLTLSLVLTGCGTDLTDEENKIIAEYAADLLLKYDASYQAHLLEDTEEDPGQTTEEPSTEPVTTESTTESASTTAQEQNTDENTTQENTAQDTETTEGTETEGEDDSVPPSDSGSITDIAGLIGLEGISIVYNRCMFLDRYPSLDQDGAFIYLNADPGYKLVVVKFDVKNLTTEDILVDLLNVDIDYRLVMNRSHAAKPMLTILMDDLGTFQNGVPGNTEQSAVLIFQMSDSMIQQIETLDIRVTYQNEEYTILIQ